MIKLQKLANSHRARSDKFLTVHEDNDQVFEKKRKNATYATYALIKKPTDQPKDWFQMKSFAEWLPLVGGMVALD